MADTEKDKVWVNSLVERDLVKILDQMVEDVSRDSAKSNRAAFVKWLIEQEAMRRGYLPGSPTKKNRMTERVLA
jgi:hypothetical protein